MKALGPEYPYCVRADFTVRFRRVCEIVLHNAHCNPMSEKFVSDALASATPPQMGISDA
jgi:hypothetical protein